MTAEQYKEGQIILIDKPYRWTSFDVVKKIRYLICKRYGIKKLKVGHAGTLDPLATGLLVLCTGKMTKRIDEFQGEAKTYEGTMVVGATTPSFDLETEINQTFPIDHLTEEDLERVKQQFVGTIEQKPPVFSALKQNGKRLYTLAREGKEVEVKKRKVEITVFELTKIQLPELNFRVCCSKGTYIRSLAQDFGKALNNGAHLGALRRTQSGAFSVAHAQTVADFETQVKAGGE